MNDGRVAKPVGRVLRLLTGTALTLIAVRAMLSWEATLNLQVAGVMLGLFALYLVVHLAISRLVPSINAWLGAVIAVVPVFLVYSLGGPAGQVGSLFFIGVSLVATAIRADGGCEVMTLAGILTGQRTHLVCIVFSPLDWIEARLTGRTSTRHS